jgi:hypothetical protein
VVEVILKRERKKKERREKERREKERRKKEERKKEERKKKERQKERKRICCCFLCLLQHLLVQLGLSHCYKTFLSSPLS